MWIKDDLTSFVQKARLKHGTLYSYTLVEYVNSVTDIVVICQEHGEFITTPSRHLRGTGCPFCALKRRARKQALGTEGFILRAKQIHGNRYDYSKVNYLNRNTAVVLVCPKHGEFSQVPKNHLAGNNCPACTLESKTKSKEKFVEQAEIKHFCKYDYSLTEYLGVDYHVEITCKEHGVFRQTAWSHLSGQGCPQCAKHGFDSKKEAGIYVLISDNMVKVGITNKSSRVRCLAVSVASGKTFETALEIRATGELILSAEQEVLKTLRSMYPTPEGPFDGYTECFIGADQAYVERLVIETVRRKTNEQRGTASNKEA